MNKREMVSSWIKKAKQRSSSLFPACLIIFTVLVMLAALAFNRAQLFTTYADCVQTSPTGITGTITPSPTDTATTATPSPTNTATASATPCQTTMTSYSASDGQILWTGDWEQDGQWALHTGMPDWGNSSVERVQNPVRQGQYSAKFTVNSGAPSGSNDERAEVSATQQDTGGYTGQDWYYSWSTYVPSVPNKATGWSTWTDITQWMDMRHNCSPPLQVEIVPGSNSNNNTPQFLLDHELNSQTTPCDYSKPADLYPLANLTYDQWTDFTIHIKWSEDPQVGYVQLWVNGQNVLPLTHMQTLDPNSTGVYMEQALYRPDRSGTNVLYMDATRRHTAYSPISSSTPCVTATTTPDSTPTAAASSTPTTTPTPDSTPTTTASSTPTNTAISDSTPTTSASSTLTDSDLNNGNTSNSKHKKKKSSSPTATATPDPTPTLTPDPTSTLTPDFTPTAPLTCTTPYPTSSASAATPASTPTVTPTTASQHTSAHTKKTHASKHSSKSPNGS